MNTKKRFGLVGKNISYSFSKAHFSKKFEKLALHNHSYENFDLENIQDFPEIFKGDSAGLIGLNVTIPYKEKVAEYLDAIDEDAATIGAINTIKMEASGRKVGYNTDVYGFKNSLLPLLQPHHKKALILGTGGASKAVAFAFDQLGISYVFVSRTPSLHQLSYKDLNAELMETHHILVNCSPLGTSPNTALCPEIPYASLTEKHLLYDLIYNPAETTFLRRGKEQGASIKNGLEMLELQAEKSWEIWND